MKKADPFFKNGIMDLGNRVRASLLNYRRYKFNKLYVFMFLFGFLVSYSSLNAQTKFYLGTANKGVSYYDLGKSIKKFFNSKDYPEKIDFIETQGSTDNIYKLQKGEIDIALSQNDIAFFAENGMAPFNKPVQNLRAIMSLYPEPIFMLSNDPDLFSITQFKNVKVNVGPKSSGLIEDSKILLNSAGVWNSIHKFYLSPAIALEMLKKGKLQVVFVNNLSPEARTLILQKKLTIVSIPAILLSGLCKTFPYLNIFWIYFIFLTGSVNNIRC